MRLDVYLPFVLAALFGAAAPAFARRLPPSIATWLLGVGGLVCGGATTASLGFLAWTLIGQSPDLAGRGGWSAQALRMHDPVATPVAAVALALLVVVVGRLALVAFRRFSALASAHRLAAALPAHDGLVVVDDPALPACAVPGRPGRVVIARSLLQRLSAGERRAVLAHERAHLALGHHWHHSAARLACAANPLLCRLPAAVELATERWADEIAARAAGRDTVAGALRVAATGARSAGVVLAAAAVGVPERLAALRAPAPRPSVWRVAALVAIAVAAVSATLMAAHDTDALFDLAHHVYLASHGGA